MRKIYFLLIAVAVFSEVAVGQTTYTWVGGASGDYQVAANWLPARNTPAITDILAFDATGAISIVNVPNQTIGAVQITAGTSSVSFATNVLTNVLTLNAATPLIFSSNGKVLASDFMTIALGTGVSFTMTTGTLGIVPGTGGKIRINGTLTLSGGTLDFDVAGTGGTTINGTVTYISGNFVSTNVTAINWANASNYNHSVDGTAASAIPLSTWASGSTCTILGLIAGTTVPQNLTKNTFFNLRWNCSAQFADVLLISAGDTITATGTLTILNTSTRKLRLAGTAGGLIRAGAYIQSGGTVVMQAADGITTLRVSGAYSQGGGTLDALDGSGSGTANLELAGNLSKTGSSIWQCSSSNNAAQMNLVFNGTATQNVTISGTWSAPAQGRSNIAITNPNLVSGVSLTGMLRVYNSNSAQAATCTLTGIVTITGGGSGISYTGAGAGGTTLIYNWIYPQNASVVEFPTTNGPRSLTINNALGVTFPASFNRTLSGTLSLLNGNLDMPGSTLTLSNTALANQLVHTNGYIFRGILGRYFPTTGLPTNGTTVNSRFPFAAGTNDRSVNVFFSGANLTAGTAGYIYVSHNAVINATAVTINDDIVLDKRSNSSWTLNTASFNLGSGGHTISVTALGTNIGAVTDISTLRLTNGTGLYGILIPTTGSITAPLVGKSGLLVADITARTVYFGSNNLNALQILTYTWTGNVNSNWTNPGNWTSIGAGYPSAPTDIADISSTLNHMPEIPTATSINLYQLIVGAPITLSMPGTAAINIANTVTFNGSAVLSPTSTFAYSGGSGVTQNIAALTYGNLVFSGTGTKILPATVTVTGNYLKSGAEPVVTGNTFVFAGAGAQKISEGIYNNLTITGNRGGAEIGIGNLVAENDIYVSGAFIVTATNYTVRYDFNYFIFNSSGTQTVPGFQYSTLEFDGGGPRILDPLGSTDPAHVIQVRSIYIPSGVAVTATGSKVRMLRESLTNFVGNKDVNYHDLEIAGNLGGANIRFFGRTNVQGQLTLSLTNFVFLPNYNNASPSLTAYFNFNGTADQVIPATPGNFAFDNIYYERGNRNVTLQPSGTINVYGSITNYSATPWSAGKGFVTAGSTVNFIEGSFDVPVLQPATGGSNYHNVSVTGGTRQLGGDVVMSGNLNITGTDALPGSLKTGNGSSVRNLTILGNLTVTGTSSLSQVTGQLDLNTGTSGTTNINLAGNLTVSGFGQLVTTGSKNGTIFFNGTTQQYTHTSPFKNMFLNYTVGNGTGSTLLTLNNSIELNRSLVAALKGTLTVSNNASLNAGTHNIRTGDGVDGNALFDLAAGSTLITANTGGVEGAATDGTTGTVLTTDALLVKTYSATASYVLNGATSSPFPAAAVNMLNLTLGANVSLNHSIVASGTVNLASSMLTQAGHNLTFSGLASTTGSIYANKNSTITISGVLGTVGPLRFAPGGNTTGQLAINRPLSIPLNSDLTIDPTPHSGNLVTIASSELDINGYTLTINGAVTGAGTIGGSNTSNLTLGGTAGILNFTSGKQVLKDFTLVGSATATIGTPLDITAGTSPGNAGAVTVTGTSLLTTGGNLTLKSNVHGTARVGQGAITGGYINGDVTVERFIESSPKRAWRLLAAPAYGQTIKEAWQENQPAGVNPGNGFGTIITSNSGAWAANGFDYQTPGNSLLVYNPATNVWDGVTNTNTPINSAGGNKAYMVFIRGDRSATPSNGPASTSANVRIRGTLYQGNLPAVPVSVPGQFVAIGNNYASAIDFTTLGDANVDQTFTVWDPKLVGSSGLGGYVTFSASTSPAWIPVPAGGSYTAGVPNTRIESGQGFVVYSTSGGGNIILKESSKVSGSNMVFRPMPNAGGFKPSLTTNLHSNIGGNAIISDGNIVVFSDNYSNDIDNKDALKVTNTAENFGILRNNKTLIVEARQPVTTTDTVFFDIRKMKAQPYKLELTTKYFDGTVTGWLEDKYLKKLTPLNMDGTITYDFVLSANAAESYAPDRFRVVFSAARPLPVGFSTIKAAQQGKNIAVEWKVDNELNVRRYDVEKSTDGRNFTKLGEVNAKGSNSSYTWLDENAFDGDNFYRIRSNDNDGTFAYSKTVKINMATRPGNGSFVIFPNPVKDGMISLQMKNTAAGIYNIRLINQVGQVLERTLINHAGGNATQSFQLPKNPGEGVYQLEIISPENKSTTLKMLVLGN